LSISLNRNDLITIRQYLLGQLPEEQQQAIEQRLLTEDDLFEELEVAEDELFDEYVADELTSADRKQFEQYFLATPERQQELKFAAGLRQYVAKKTAVDDALERPVGVRPALDPTGHEAAWPDQSQTARPGQSQIAWLGRSQLYRIAAITAFVMIAGALWVTRLERHPPTSYAPFTLTISSNNRGDGGAATEIKLPLAADAARLYLKLPETLDQTTRFRVELLKDSGQTINIENVARIEQAAVIELPAAQLSPGEYALRLYVVKSDGTEQRINGSYFLSVK
jgi:hypothetical protein